MINYNSPAALKTFLEQEGLGMQKKFGQNFLINPQIRKSLADALGAKEGDEVWEIGPGLGAMTELLLENKLKVKAFEIDKGFIRVLKKIFAAKENFFLIEGDVMKTWQNESAQLKHLEQQKQREPFLLGNLPYNVGSALLADFIEKKRIFSRMVVTVQKEVALRMTAAAGSKDYSSFSVLCASAYNVKPLMLIRKESFYPQPNVESMGVLLEKKENREYPEGNLRASRSAEVPDIFFPLVRALFSSRRKTIKNNLSNFISSLNIPQENCAAVFKENGLDGRERAETLDIDTFYSLAKSIENMRL